MGEISDHRDRERGRHRGRGPHRGHGLRRTHGQAGFTLVELMVVTAVLGLLMSTILRIHLAVERQQDRGYRAVVAGQHARTGLDMVARDLRMAGSGIGNIPISASFGGVAIPWRYPILPGPSFADADSVEIIGAQRGVQTTLAVNMMYENAAIRVVDPSGFEVGDMIVISNDSGGHLFQITGIVGDELQHDGGLSPWNQGGMQWPPFGYPSGTRVTPVEYVRYYVDAGDAEHPVLLRWRASEPSPTFVSKDVEALRFMYTEGDTLVADPVDPLNIRSVRVTAVTVAGNVLDPDLVRRQLTAIAAPRILD